MRERAIQRINEGNEWPVKVLPPVWWRLREASLQQYTLMFHKYIPPVLLLEE